MTGALWRTHAHTLTCASKHRGNLQGEKVTTGLHLLLLLVGLLVLWFYYGDLFIVN